MKRVRSKPAFQNVGARGLFENSNNSLPPLAGKLMLSFAEAYSKEISEPLLDTI